MPCFKGLAVSIHTPDGPLPEHSIQKQSRVSRITSYIPVPTPKINPTTLKPEQSTFAISITLLTPGLTVPYSTPKPTPDDPHPRPQAVGGIAGITGGTGRYAGAIGPYIPLTTSPNETIAAYIYFDGRQKEEVATLLRRGEETWVNSRWVGVPESEGGGLAEREFLFREVGLERWLNGLDLEGKDVAATIERRRQRMEKRRRRRKENKGSDDEDSVVQWSSREKFDKGVLRYGADERSPLEKLSDDEELFSSDDDSDDDPVPEATGQIKVALFRVLASGEIKKGEYSPQFDAHDDDEDIDKTTQNGDGANGEASGEADIDHTTSFAKPKTLDPKSISTQTVTGIDGPDKPYTVFTFLYRGEKQLQKMGILKPSKTSDKPTATTAKRRSMQPDFTNLKPLKAGGTMGFSSFREVSDPREKPSSKNGAGDAMESDDDDDLEIDRVEKLAEPEGDDFKNGLLSPEDAKRQGELAEGVKKIKLKRQHSFDPPTPSPGPPATRSPASASASPPPADSPPALLPSSVYDPVAEKTHWGDKEREAWGGKKLPSEDIIGSPMKRQRASVSGLETEMRRGSGELAKHLGLGLALGVPVQGGFGGELVKGAGIENGNVGPFVRGSGVKKEQDRMEEEEL